MDHSYPSIEFEAEVSADGTVRIPAPLMKTLKGTTLVTIRLTKGAVSKKLHQRGVTEEEIERIAEMQLEQREQVIRFLESEGALRSDKAFSRRADALLGKRK